MIINEKKFTSKATFDQLAQIAKVVYSTPGEDYSLHVRQELLTYLERLAVGDNDLEDGRMGTGKTCARAIYYLVTGDILTADAKDEHGRVIKNTANQEIVLTKRAAGWMKERALNAKLAHVDAGVCMHCKAKLSQRIVTTIATFRPNRVFLSRFPVEMTGNLCTDCKTHSGFTEAGFYVPLNKGENATDAMKRHIVLIEAHFAALKAEREAAEKKGDEMRAQSIAEMVDKQIVDELVAGLKDDEAKENAKCDAETIARLLDAPNVTEVKLGLLDAPSVTEVKFDIQAPPGGAKTRKITGSTCLHGRPGGTLCPHCGGY